ncbi:3-hydroxyacyl-CoA dehydrogenase [Geobacillus subterraneus]
MVATIGVVGAGTMGGGIANLAALSGLNVILVDIDEHMLQKAHSRMEAFMDKSVAKGKLTAEQKHEALYGLFLRRI